MFYTYILKSLVNGSYYVGSTSNIESRLILHNKDFVVSTKRYCPWELLYSEEYIDLKLARQREIQIKSWKKRAKIEELLKHYKIF